MPAEWLKCMLCNLLNQSGTLLEQWHFSKGEGYQTYFSTANGILVQYDIPKSALSWHWLSDNDALWEWKGMKFDPFSIPQCSAFWRSTIWSMGEELSSTSTSRVKYK